MAEISDAEFGGMIGNAMSINVLCRLIPCALFAAGFASEEEVSAMMSHSGWD